MKYRAGVCLCVVLASVCAGADETAWKALMDRGAKLEDAGDFASAAATYQQAFEAAKTAGDPVNMGLAMNSLATSHGEMGRPLDAELEYGRALQLIEKSAGKDGLIYARISTNLAWHYVDRHEDLRAEKAVRQAISIYERQLPAAGDVRLAVALHCLAGVLLRAHDYEQASTTLQRAIAIFEKNPLQNRAHLAATSNSLALVRSRQGRREEAVQQYERAAALLEEDVSYSQALVRVLNNLGREYADMGRAEESERSFQRALAIARDTVGTEHMIYGTVLLNYSAMLQKNGRKKEGKALEAKSRGILAQEARSNGKGMTADVSMLRED